MRSELDYNHRRFEYLLRVDPRGVQMSGTEHLDLRSANLALRIALEGMLKSLGHEQQHQVIQHLRDEASNLQAAYGDITNSWIKHSVQRDAEAIRQLALRLDEFHTATMHLEQHMDSPDVDEASIDGQ